MLSLKDIKHEKFYIDCVDNATLIECIKLLPYKKNWVQLEPPLQTNKIIVVEDNISYYTINGVAYETAIVYNIKDISEFTYLHQNWYDTVHVMD